VAGGTKMSIQITCPYCGSPALVSSTGRFTCTRTDCLPRKWTVAKYAVVRFCPTPRSATEASHDDRIHPRARMASVRCIALFADNNVGLSRVWSLVSDYPPTRRTINRSKTPMHRAAHQRWMPRLHGAVGEPPAVSHTRRTTPSSTKKAQPACWLWCAG
jgi:hypothetical protein